MAKKIFVAGAQATAAEMNAEVKTTFGGDGSDGALAITSGTTTIDCAGAQVVIKNYTSISITSTGKLAFSNPHANGTTVILKSQGNVTLTSSQAPMIDCSAMGGTGGAALSTGTGSSDGNAGSDAIGFLVSVLGATAVRSASNAGGLATLKPMRLTTHVSKYYSVCPGSGGGGGNKNISNGVVNTAAGGRGGGALVIECGGAWNFTTASGISVAATAGGTATNSTSTQYGVSGGSGGGGGCCLVMYNSLTANSGTITVTGGAAGTGVSAGIGSGLGSPWGPAGGGSVATQGTTSLQGTDTTASAGVAGGTGIAVVVANQDVA